MHPRYQREYAYGLVQPESGTIESLLLPAVSIEAFNVALAHFAG